MTQGRADYKVADKKVEPKAHAVNPGGVDMLGQATHFKKVPIYEGRGLEAPMKGTEVHHCGSQGKH